MIVHCTRIHPLPDRVLSRVHVEYDGPMHYTYLGWQSQPGGASPEPRPFGWALEDTDRGLTSDMTIAEIQAIKVHGETAIPTGDYEVRITKSARWNRLMPQIMGVPGFGGVRPHAGNGPKDTEGCPLLGMSLSTYNPPGLRDSRVASDWLERRITECLARGERVRWRVSR